MLLEVGHMYLHSSAESIYLQFSDGRARERASSLHAIGTQEDKVECTDTALLGVVLLMCGPHISHTVWPFLVIDYKCAFLISSYY